MNSPWLLTLPFLIQLCIKKTVQYYKKARCWQWHRPALKWIHQKRREYTPLSLSLISHVVLGNLIQTIKEGLVKTSLQACLEKWFLNEEWKMNFSIWCCNTFDNKRGHWHVQGIRDELPIKVGMSTYSCSSVDKKANICHHFDLSGKSATRHSHFRLLWKDMT